MLIERKFSSIGTIPCISEVRAMFGSIEDAKGIIYMCKFCYPTKINIVLSTKKIKAIFPCTVEAFLNGPESKKANLQKKDAAI